jgi:hypothetical protein
MEIYLCYFLNKDMCCELITLDNIFLVNDMDYIIKDSITYRIEEKIFNADKNTCKIICSIVKY